MPPLWVAEKNECDGRQMLTKTHFLKEALLISFFLPAFARAQDALFIRPVYSRSELRRLIRTAHTPAASNSLADYFDAKRQQFAGKALEEKAELDRLLARPYILSKYPSPVDTARGLLWHEGRRVWASRGLFSAASRVSREYGCYACKTMRLTETSK